jgi:hypothetical protein
VLHHDENFGAVVGKIGDAGDDRGTLNLSDINVVKNRGESQASSHVLGVVSSAHQGLKENYLRDNGDRFIPCRSGCSKYELQY